MTDHVSASSVSTPEALLVAATEPANTEFRSRTIVITRPEDVYQRWVYFRSDDRSGVGYIDDVTTAPLLHDELNTTRFVLWVKTARGATRKMRASVGTEIELASPHHVHQWVAEHEAALLGVKRTNYAGVPVVLVLVGLVLGGITDNILGSGLAITLTLGGLAAITAVALASEHDRRIRAVTRVGVRNTFGGHAIAHIAVLNAIAAAEEEARLAAEAAEAARTQETDDDTGPADNPADHTAADAATTDPEPDQETTTA